MFEQLRNIDVPSQGDLFRWANSHQVRPWRTYGIVITADCDLVWQKSSGAISYVPAFTTLDLIWYRWRLETLPPIRNQQLAGLSKRVNRARDKLGRGPLTDQALTDLLARNSVEDALSAVGIEAQDQRQTLRPICDRIKKLDCLLKAGSPSLPDLKDVFSDQEGDFTPSVLGSKIQKFLSNLPGDIFQVPQIEPFTDDALFVMLRHVGEISVSSLTARADEVRFGNAEALRVGRVTPQVRYALTQQFARVFSDIGLPTEYETLCKEGRQDFLAKEIL